MTDNILNLVSKDTYEEKMDALIQAVQSSGGGSSISLDDTLTEVGKAAEAKAVGEAIGAVADSVDQAIEATNTHTGSRSNPHGVTAEQINAAPGGFGWGTNQGAQLPNNTADEARITGLYDAHGGLHVPENCELISVFSDGEQIWQTAYCTDDNIYHRMYDEGWSTWCPVTVAISHPSGYGFTDEQKGIARANIDAAETIKQPTSFTSQQAIQLSRADFTYDSDAGGYTYWDRCVSGLYILTEIDFSLQCDLGTVSKSQCTIDSVTETSNSVYAEFSYQGEPLFTLTNNHKDLKIECAARVGQPTTFTLYSLTPSAYSSAMPVLSVNGTRPGKYGDMWLNAAPGGFGWGSMFAKDMKGTTMDEVWETGLYRNFLVTCHPSVSLIQVVSVDRSRSYQIAYMAGNGMAIRQAIRDDKSVTQWEWINPPMEDDWEYQTTERYNNYPVFVKKITGLVFPTSGESDLPTGLSVSCRILDYEMWVQDSAQTFCDKLPEIGSAGNMVRFVCGTSTDDDGRPVIVVCSQHSGARNAFAIVKYYKTV